MQALAVLALSLRVLVPGGYMPASVADGWYLQWCPDGVSVEVLEALFGQSAAGDSAHAHHLHHAGPGPGDPSAPAAEQFDGPPAYAQCDLSGFSADLHHAVAPPLLAPTALSAVRHRFAPTPVHAKRPLRYRSRAPPTLVLS